MQPAQLSLDEASQWADIASFAVAGLSILFSIIAWVIASRAKQRADTAIERAAKALERAFPSNLEHASFRISSDSGSLIIRNTGGAKAHDVRLFSGDEDLSKVTLSSGSMDVSIGEERSRSMTPGSIKRLREVTVTWLEGQETARRSQHAFVYSKDR